METHAMYIHSFGKKALKKKKGLGPWIQTLASG